jgi:hypothetical protein
MRESAFVSVLQRLVRNVLNAIVDPNPVVVLEEHAIVHRAHVQITRKLVRSRWNLLQNPQLYVSDLKKVVRRANPRQN